MKQNKSQHSDSELSDFRIEMMDRSESDRDKEELQKFVEENKLGVVNTLKRIPAPGMI